VNQREVDEMRPTACTKQAAVGGDRHKALTTSTLLRWVCFSSLAPQTLLLRSCRTIIFTNRSQGVSPGRR
jgi:hypothetical protein